MAHSNNPADYSDGITPQMEAMSDMAMLTEYANKINNLVNGLDDALTDVDGIPLISRSRQLDFRRGLEAALAAADTVNSDLQHFIAQLEAGDDARDSDM